MSPRTLTRIAGLLSAGILATVLFALPVLAAPIVTVTGVSDGATYELSEAPMPGCSTEDGGEGISSQASLSLSTLVDNGGGLGTFLATCSGAEDGDGHPGPTATATYTIIADGNEEELEDIVPSVEVTGVEDGGLYLFGGVPAAGCETTDEGGGVGASAKLLITGGDSNGRGEFTATCSGATNLLGTPADPVSMTYFVFSPPIVSILDVEDGATYALGAVPATICVTVSGGYGIAQGATPSFSGGIAGAGEITFTCAGARDLLGNVTPPVSVTYTVTVNAPEILVASPANGGVYSRGNVPVATCLVNTQGVPLATPASVEVTGGDAYGLGEFTVTCSGATDVLGQVGEPDTITYTVEAPTSDCGTSVFTGNVRVKLNAVIVATIPVIVDVRYTSTCAFKSVDITTVGGSIIGSTLVNMATGWKAPVKQTATQYAISIQAPSLSAASIFISGAYRQMDTSTKMTVKFQQNERLYLKLTGFAIKDKYKPGVEIETIGAGLEPLDR